MSFLVLYVLPGDPVDRLLASGQDVSPEQVEALREHYGLNAPLPVQYLTQLWHVVSFSPGTSFASGRPVVDMISEALPSTLELTGAALAIAVVSGVLLALVATYIRTPALRQALLALPAAGVAVPGFWLGLMLLWGFSFTIPVFPAMGGRGVASLVLPAVALAVPTGAAIAQILSRSLLEEWNTPYAEVAESKGLSRLTVHLRHVLRNAAGAVITVFALTVGGLLGGSVIAETIFARNGLGRLTQQAVTTQDVPVVQAVVVLAALVYVVANLITDLLYPVIDPRLRDRPRTS